MVGRGNEVAGVGYLFAAALYKHDLVALGWSVGDLEGHAGDDFFVVVKEPDHIALGEGQEVVVVEYVAVALVGVVGFVPAASLHKVLRLGVGGDWGAGAVLLCAAAGVVEVQAGQDDNVDVAGGDALAFEAARELVAVEPDGLFHLVLAL